MYYIKIILFLLISFFVAKSTLAETFTCTALNALKLTTVAKEEYKPKELLVQIQSDSLALIRERIGGDKTPSAFQIVKQNDFILLAIQQKSSGLETVTINKKLKSLFYSSNKPDFEEIDAEVYGCDF